MSQGNFWRSFNEGWRAVDPAVNRLNTHWERRNIADAYTQGYGLGPVDSATYAKHADMFGDPTSPRYNPEAAAVYRQAAEANYAVPTEIQRKARGLGAISDYYHRTGQMDKALEFDRKRLAMDEIAANRAWREEQQQHQRDEHAWRTEQQEQKRREWERQQQARDAVAQVGLYTPDAHRATMARLDELGPAGEQARGLYRRHFQTSHQDAMAAAANRLGALGDIRAANELHARAKQIQDEGIFRTAELIRAGAPASEVRKAFDSTGLMRLDSDPVIEKTKGGDFRIKYSVDGRPGVINSLNQFERSAMDIVARSNLEMNEERMRLYRAQAARDAARGMRPAEYDLMGTTPEGIPVFGLEGQIGAFVMGADGKAVPYMGVVQTMGRGSGGGADAPLPFEKFVEIYGTKDPAQDRVAYQRHLRFHAAQKEAAQYGLEVAENSEGVIGFRWRGGKDWYSDAQSALQAWREAKTPRQGAKTPQQRWSDVRQFPLPPVP